MSAKGYTNKTNIENFGLIDINATFASSQLDAWIEGVEDIIDTETGRNFIADSEASDRMFNGQGDRALVIDDAIEITLVEVGLDDFGGSFVTVPDTGSNRYFTEPANHVSKEKPVTKILLRDRLFTTGMQNHRITAKWGYSVAVPKDIQFAATVFAFGIVNQQKQGGSSVKSERIGNYQVSYNSEDGRDSWGDFARAMDILNGYKRYYL